MEYNTGNEILEDICLKMVETGEPFEKLLKSRQLCNLIFRSLKFSDDILVRNLVMPRYLIWAPVSIGPRYLLIINHRPKSDNYILSFMTRELLVIDADGTPLERLAQIAIEKYPNDRFYIHKTNSDKDNYHIICVSRPILHNSQEAIEMRYYFNCDAAYSQISLYRGYAVRLISKKPGQEFTYPYIMTIGHGQVDQTMDNLYQQILQLVQEFGNYHVNSFKENLNFRLKLYNMWKQCQNNYNHSFYFKQLKGVAPAELMQAQTQEQNNDVEFQIFSSQYGHPQTTIDIVKYLQRKFCYSCRDDKSFELVDASIRSIQFPWPEVNNNTLLSNSEYTIAVDITLNYYFQVFKRFFYVDIDDKGRLRIIYEFARLNPGYRTRSP